MPHVVRGIGAVIAAVERKLNDPAAAESCCPAAWSQREARWRGRWLVGIVLAAVGLPAAGALAAAYAVSPALGLAVEAALCCQCLAAKSLREESARVGAALAAGDLGRARRDVAMIVGRDTDRLDQAGVARAAVETVAENTSDGVVAPLIAMLIAGGFGGLVYKAVNTLDSMIGYRDARYRDLGRAAAKLDDAVNWLPARLTAGLMVAAAPLAGADWRGAWRVWRRDGHRHPSPNAGQPEAACAGALGVQLGGAATYGGTAHDKPLIGAPGRAPGPDDIAAAGRLMSATGWLALTLAVAARLALWRWGARARR
jgi:adenosylcobinamide-phosphate synthase